MSTHNYHVVLGRVLPIDLEQILAETQETVIAFQDNALHGPHSKNSVFDAGQRYEYWKKILSPEIGLRYFEEENRQYQKIREHIAAGGTITIWRSDDPREILLFWAIAHFLSPTVCKDRIQLGHYSRQNYQSTAPIRTVSQSEIDDAAKFWTTYVEDYRSLKYFSHENLDVKSVYNAKSVDIDQELRKRMNGKMNKLEIISDICSKYEWIGERFLLHRYDELAKSME